MAVRTYISIITLNVNWLNAPNIRHRLAEWIQKQDSCTCRLQETHFRPKDHIDWKWEDGKIKSFSDKQKLTEFSTTKPALQQMLKGLI